MPNLMQDVSFGLGRARIRCKSQDEKGLPPAQWRRGSGPERGKGEKLADLAFIEDRETEAVDNGMCDPAFDDVSGLDCETQPERPFEERLYDLERAVVRQPLHREILYRTLAFCETGRLLREVEEEIESYPEFQHAVQDQYHLALVLERAGGLERIELDEDGEVVTADRKAGLSEDEVDDLVYDVRFETTELGREFVSRHTPKARLEELLDLVPARRSTYVEVLEFCEEPRSYDEVKKLLEGRDVLHAGEDGTRQPIQPSVFLDKLERAGAVVWDGAWRLTEGGKDFLGELKGL